MHAQVKPGIMPGPPPPWLQVHYSAWVAGLSSREGGTVRHWETQLPARVQPAQLWKSALGSTGSTQGLMSKGEEKGAWCCRSTTPQIVPVLLRADAGMLVVFGWQGGLCRCHEPP